jgi:hypothetical protein
VETKRGITLPEKGRTSRMLSHYLKVLGVSFKGDLVTTLARLNAHHEKSPLGWPSGLSSYYGFSVIYSVVVNPPSFGISINDSKSKTSGEYSKVAPTLKGVAVVQSPSLNKYCRTIFVPSRFNTKS